MLDPSSHSLIPAAGTHLREMMSWFASAHSCALWGGPAFRFPFTEETFVADSKCRELPSYVLLGNAGVLCAFGQFYSRADRCHLGRLAVAPSMRGKGIGTRLIELLASEGTRELGTTECSLFVSFANPGALALYERVGFQKAPYPEAGRAVANSHYMIVPWQQLDSNIRALRRSS